MNSPHSGGIGSQRIRPTLETKFHIDYEWWDREGQDLRVYLLSHLSPDQREKLVRHSTGGQEIDWIDPVTAEVRRVDPLERALQEACEREDFITPHTSLVDAIFRAFLQNGNTPLSANELGELIGRPPMTILRTLTGQTVYKGIRPIVATPDADPLDTPSDTP